MQELASQPTTISWAQQSDSDLLKTFASTGCEEAFKRLVQRHASFVYASALRQVSDPTTAQDIAQAAFIVLARKAGSIKNEIVLSGWLFRAVHYLVLELRRSAARRHEREQEAAKMHRNSTKEEAESVWERCAPHLDEALASLRPKDRTAVLLRFFEQKPWAEVGSSSGFNEGAARIQVNRAELKLGR